MSRFKNLFEDFSTSQLESGSIAFTMSLNQIQDGQTGTRGLRADHVEALAESISVLGLLEPLVVDKNGKLLAGGHRIAAIKRLHETGNEAFSSHFPEGQIPVRIMDFDSSIDPELAFQIEVAENEHRRDYTVEEVRAIADRLLSAGYVDTKGRPKKGDKALRPALAVILGKHQRTVRRYLNEERESSEKVGQDDLLLERKILRKLEKNLLDLQRLNKNVPENEKRKKLAKDLQLLIELVGGM